MLDDIAQRLQADYSMKVAGKHLRQGLCPECSQKSLWTFAASAWVVRCERLNNCGYEAHARELYSDLFESWSDRVHKVEEAKPAAQRSPTAVADAYLREGRGFDLALVLIYISNLRSFGWTLAMQLQPGEFGQAFLVALLAALLAGLYPAWKMGQTQPADALRAE